VRRSAKLECEIEGKTVKISTALLTSFRFLVFVNFPSKLVVLGNSQDSLENSLENVENDHFCKDFL